MSDQSVIMYEHQPPREIDGTRVEYNVSTKTEFRGQTWITILPSDDTDPRVWEYSLTSGKLLRTA